MWNPEKGLKFDALSLCIGWSKFDVFQFIRASAALGRISSTSFIRDESHK